MVAQIEAIWTTTVTTAVGGLCLHLWVTARRQLLRRMPDEELERELARRERRKAKLSAWAKRARAARRAA